MEKIDEAKVVHLSLDKHEYCMYLPDVDADYIQNYIKTQQEPYEKEMLLDMSSRLKPGQLVLDVGANIGNHTFYLAVIAECEVMSYEPNSHLVMAMNKSIRLNGLVDRVSVFQVGVGHHNSEAVFHEDLPNNIGAQKLDLGQGGSIKVIPLDECAFPQTVSMIKVDVEGMELDVLKGAEKLISQDRPHLYIECISSYEYTLISNWLMKLGYVYLNTFNATPTHLFAPIECVNLQQCESFLHGRHLLESRNFRADLNVNRKLLHDTNTKYRETWGRIEQLKQSLDAETQLKNELQDKYKHVLLEHAQVVEAFEEKISQLTNLASSQATGLADVSEQLEHSIAGVQASYSKDFLKLSEQLLEKDLAYKALQAEVVFLKARTLDYQKENKDLLNNEKNLTLKAQKMEKELSKALIIQEKKAESLSQNLIESIKNKKTINFEIDRLKQNHTQVTVNLEKSIKENNLLAKRLEELNIKLHSAQDHATQQQIRNSELHTQVVQRFNASNDSFMSLVSKLQAEKSSLEKDKIFFQQHWLESKEQIAVQVALIDNISQENKLTYDDLRKEKDNSARLEDKIKNIQIDVLALKKELMIMTGSLSDKELELGKLQAKVTELNGDKSSLEATVLKHKQVAEQAHQELLKVKQSLQQSDTELVKIRSSITYQLGYRLIVGKSSWKEMLKLPKSLFEVYKRSQAVKQKRKTKALGQQHKVEERKLPVPSSVANKTTVTEIVGKESTISSLFKGQDRNSHIKVACIMDEFTYGSYKYECDLKQLSREHWRKELEDFQPELLFIESAWRGKDEQWYNVINKNIQELQDIVSWCKAKGIPTLFWNKEDPIHMQTFLTTAQQFDYVFTTDIDCLPRYKKALGHDRVYFLPFACQPVVHNPIELYERKDAFCFAGAYYVKYPERTHDLGNFVEHLSHYKGVEIYDRNYGKNDPNYEFPENYKPFIVGTLPFNEIDKAYKGYKFSINLNSIKQSQSMFARRVYELLGSNTVTVSNFSRGLRAMFGDLVITSDSGQELVNRVTHFTNNQDTFEKFRLSGLRKVMSEHTYQDRFNYIVSKIFTEKPEKTGLPNISVVSVVETQEAMDRVVASFLAQEYEHKSLILYLKNKSLARGQKKLQDNVEIRYVSDLRHQKVTELVGGPFVTAFVAEDHYGPHYLLDLALASKYSKAVAYGKGSYFTYTAKGGIERNNATAYMMVPKLLVRNTLVVCSQLMQMSMKAWLRTHIDGQYTFKSMLSLDAYNYCLGGYGQAPVAAQVDDIKVNGGLSLSDMLAATEKTAGLEAPVVEQPKELVFDISKLAETFMTSGGKTVGIKSSEHEYLVTSVLEDGKHEYVYAKNLLPLESITDQNHTDLYFDVTPGLDIQLVALFFDKDKQRIGHEIKYPRSNTQINFLTGTAYVRLGWRVSGKGVAEVKNVYFEHQSFDPEQVYSQADTLLLTNHYPSYDDLYRNAFVHSRVKSYLSNDLNVDVFRFLRDGKSVDYHEFEDINVVNGSSSLLHKMLQNGQYKKVLVHFLDHEMWAVLKNYIDQLEVIVWVHGADIQPWWRRQFNYTTEHQLDVAKKVSEQRTTFWQSILQPMHSNLKLVFVSQQFADEVMKDLAVTIDKGQYDIIHNYIDTAQFEYQKKAAELRKHILSIRPFSSKTYANDLTVKAILDLSQEPWFQELSFTIVGDGPLFDEILLPLRGFENVVIERRFLNQAEIVEQHKKHGVFLIPTRMDTQGVSRGEAMASGLVPVTNKIAAVPDFCDDSDSILVQGEDFKGLADGIRKLYKDVQYFETLSENTARRVREQCSYSNTIGQELLLIAGKNNGETLKW